jgi:hypothetical protein
MDRATPKSDIFQANRDRAAPLLKQLRADGIGHDGRERGDYSFDFYMETKHVSPARGTHRIQKLGVI